MIIEKIWKCQHLKQQLKLKHSAVRDANQVQTKAEHAPHKKHVQAKPSYPHWASSASWKPAGWKHKSTARRKMQRQRHQHLQTMKGARQAHTHTHTHTHTQRLKMWVQAKWQGLTIKRMLGDICRVASEAGRDKSFPKVCMHMPSCIMNVSHTQTLQWRTGITSKPK